MTLFEITNGYIGESYVRAYAWAGSEADALRMCAAKNGPGDYTARGLFELGAAPFCTSLIDDGWPEDEPEQAHAPR